MLRSSELDGNYRSTCDKIFLFDGLVKMYLYSRLFIITQHIHATLEKSSLWLFVKGVCATSLVEKNKYFVTNSSIPL